MRRDRKVFLRHLRLQNMRVDFKLVFATHPRRLAWGVLARACARSLFVARRGQATSWNVWLTPVVTDRTSASCWSENIMTRSAAFSFSGCGLLAGYHLGAWSAISQHGGHAFRRAPLIGCSGGALVAGTIASGVSTKFAAGAMQNIVDGVLQAGGIFRTDLLSLVRSALNEVLPDDAHSRCSGRLMVCVTDASGLPWSLPEPVLHAEWRSRPALLDSLLASSYIPLVTARELVASDSAGPPAPRLLDGGLSGQNFPLHPTAHRTVRVSPFAGDLDICPTSQHGEPRRILLPAGVRVDVSRANASAVWRAFAPSSCAGAVESQQASGYEDACRWLQAAEG